MRIRVQPRSMAGRTAVVLLIGFAVIQFIGLMIHAYDEYALEHIAQQRAIGTHDTVIYRRVAFAPPKDRAAIIASEEAAANVSIFIEPGPPADDSTFQLSVPSREVIRASIATVGIPPEIRPLRFELRGALDPPRYVVGLQMTDGQWLTIVTPYRQPAPWRSPGFGLSFLVMTLMGAVVIVWAVRHLTGPVRTLAEAAEHFGRDVTNAPPLPERGPLEIVTAAVAFNTMAARIRRFIEDRTFLLTAIGHDLRTPITRLKLRAEFIDDDEVRTRTLADLDELEAMVSASLTFGRDAATTEASAPIDLPTLLRTILDETQDGAPELAGNLAYAGPDHLTVRAKPLALKRALNNLIGNAVKYGDAARITVTVRPGMDTQIDIDDDGPGIPPNELERVFEPFRRLEQSRNRETGGSGLGLAIARNNIRAQGGDIVLANRAAGGLRASVTLPPSLIRGTRPH